MLGRGIIAELIAERLELGSAIGYFTEIINKFASMPHECFIWLSLFDYELKNIDEIGMVKEDSSSFLADQVQAFYRSNLDPKDRICRQRNQFNKWSVDQSLRNILVQPQKQERKCAYTSLTILPVLMFDSIRSKLKNLRFIRLRVDLENSL